jgi:hypothetical protein
MELENQGRGPHFVNAQRDDASVIRAQVTDQAVLALPPVLALPALLALFLRSFLHEDYFSMSLKWE